MIDTTGFDTAKISGKVEYCLAKDERCRNSDRLLILHVWWTFFGHRMRKDAEGRTMIELTEILTLPSPESIRRCRQKFQQEGKYPATDSVVIERRTREKRIRKSIVEPAPYWNRDLED